MPNYWVCQGWIWTCLLLLVVFLIIFFSHTRNIYSLTLWSFPNSIGKVQVKTTFSSSAFCIDELLLSGLFALHFDPRPFSHFSYYESVQFLAFLFSNYYPKSLLSFPLLFLLPSEIHSTKSISIIGNAIFW